MNTLNLNQVPNQGHSFRQHQQKNEFIQLQTSDGQILSAVYTVPTLTPLRGGVLLLSGSGIIGPDGDVSSPFIGTPFRSESAKLNEQLAIKLAQEGYASLRFAKRGWDNPSEIIHHDIPHLLADARVAFAELQSRCKDVKNAIIGFSEGSIIANLLAAEIKQVNALFLLAPISRPIDDVLKYQFIDWPVKILSKMLNHKNEFITETDVHLNDSLFLPLTEIKLKDLFLQYGNRIELETTIRQIYQKNLDNVMNFILSSPLLGWYHSMKELPEFQQTARKVKASVHCFIANEDSQSNPEWAIEDFQFFSKRATMKTFSGVGHCFAPYHDGLMLKSSGPFIEDVVEELIKLVSLEL